MKRLRQVVFVASELEPLVGHLAALLGTDVAFRDPGVAEFGLVNAVLPVGNQFVEVISPVRDDAPARRYLERRKGDGGYMLIFETGDLTGDEARLSDLGVRYVWSIDLPEIAARHLHPKDTGGALLSLDQPVPPGSWKWAGRWRDVPQTGGVTAIRRAVVEADDPGALARRWRAVLGLGQGGTMLDLGDTSIEVVEAGPRGEGLAGFEVAASDPGRVLDVARDRGLDVSDGAVLVGGMKILLATSAG